MLLYEILRKIENRYGGDQFVTVSESGNTNFWMGKAKFIHTNFSPEAMQRFAHTEPTVAGISIVLE